MAHPITVRDSRAFLELVNQEKRAEMASRRKFIEVLNPAYVNTHRCVKKAFEEIEIPNFMIQAYIQMGGKVSQMKAMPPECSIDVVAENWKGKQQQDPLLKKRIGW